MSADISDPRPALLSNLDISSCRIEFSNEPIVLLCGGKVKIKDRADDPTPPVASLRHAITNDHPSFEIFRPEEITSWQSDGVFKDLMSFEKELASICSLVVIILESEGALVELGAFSQLSELSEKIIAICPSKYRMNESFINLGILRFILNKNTSGVKSYPWEIENPVSITQDVIDDVILDIQDQISQIPKSQTLKLDQNSHVIILICELLKLFIALKETEIFEYLTSLGAPITKDNLKEKLFLLKEFRIVKTQDYSDALFYMCGKEKFHKLRISLKEKSETVDTLRFEIECLEFYKNNSKHRNRHRAINLARQGRRS